MSKNFSQRAAFGRKIGLSSVNAATLAKLSGPEDIQDFISSLRANPEKNGHTLYSVARTLQFKNAQCIEGAFVAAAALWMQGHKPLLMDLRAKGDSDHVVALFRIKDHWGAISKSNHVWLRWRDPVYKSLRELAMSYFHEYTNKRKKTLRAYSAPFDLRKFDTSEWVTNKDDCWDIGAALDDARHYPLITAAQARTLKLRDDTEMKADKILQYKKNKV